MVGCRGCRLAVDGSAVGTSRRRATRRTEPGTWHRGRRGRASRCGAVLGVSEFPSRRSSAALTPCECPAGRQRDNGGRVGTPDTIPGSSDIGSSSRIVLESARGSGDTCANQTSRRGSFPAPPHTGGSDPVRLGSGPVRLSLARFGSVRLGPVQPSPARFGSTRLGSARPGSARLGSARLGSAQPCSARLVSARPSPARLGSSRLGPALLGSSRLGPALLGSARLGPVLLGPARLGSARPSPARLGSTRLEEGAVISRRGGGGEGQGRCTADFRPSAEPG